MAVSGKQLARWYRELAQHLIAGFPLQRALTSAGGVPAADRKRFAERLSLGDSWKTILSNAPRWLPEADRHVLSAAAETGRLVEGLRTLSEKHAFAAEQRGKAFTAALYPLFIINLGVLMVPARLVITHDAQTYLTLVASILVPLWVVLIFIFWSARARHRWLQLVLAVLPFLRGYVRNRSVADLSFTLGAYLSAGAPIDAAWQQSGRASGARRLARLGRRVADEAREGRSPGEVLDDAAILPEDFVALYKTGEQTGQLEENLHHLGRFYSERAAGNLQQASFWYPKLMILAVIMGVAYVAITSYQRYLDEILRMLD